MFMQVIQHVSAIYIRRHDLRIALQSFGEILSSLLQKPLMLMHVAHEQRNIRLLRKGVDILRCQGEQLVVFFKSQEIVAEVDDDVPVMRQRLDGLGCNFGRAAVVTRETEVSLFLPKKYGLLFHFFAGAAEPHSRQLEVVRLDSSVHSSSHRKRVLWSQCKCLFIGCLCRPEIPMRSIKISESKVGYVEVRVGRCQPLEILLRCLIVPCFARSESKRRKRKTADRIDYENLLVYLDGLLGTAEFHQDIAAQLQSIRIVNVDGQCIVHICECALKVPRVHFDE